MCREQRVEVTVRTAHYGIVRAEEARDDLYAAIDVCCDKLTRIFRKVRPHADGRRSYFATACCMRTFSSASLRSSVSTSLRNISSRVHHMSMYSWRFRYMSAGQGEGCSEGPVAWPRLSKGPLVAARHGGRALQRRRWCACVLCCACTALCRCQSAALAHTMQLAGGDLSGF